jgi:hypothetical protein
LGDNSKISISITHWALNINLNIAIGHYQGATGLCLGTHDKIPVDKNMLDGKIVIPDFKAMKRGRKCPKSVDGCLPESAYVPIIPPGCTQVKDVHNYDPALVIEKPQDKFKPINYEKALARCQQVMRGKKALKSVYDFLVGACATDLATTGDYDITEKTRMTFSTVIKGKIDSEKNSYDPAVREDAVRDEEKLGLGVFSCGNDDCGGSERGACTPNGCVCNTGLGGNQCAIVLDDDPMSSQSSSPSAGV